MLQFPWLDPFVRRCAVGARATGNVLAGESVHRDGKMGLTMIDDRELFPYLYLDPQLFPHLAADALAQ